MSWAIMGLAVLKSMVTSNTLVETRLDLLAKVPAADTMLTQSSQDLLKQIQLRQPESPDWGWRDQLSSCPWRMRQDS